MRDGDGERESEKKKEQLNMVACNINKKCNAMQKKKKKIRNVSIRWSALLKQLLTIEHRKTGQ